MKLVWQLQEGYANLMPEAKVLDKIEEANSIPVQADHALRGKAHQMKIKIALATLATLILSAPATAQQTELRITHATTGGAEKEVLDKIIADFEKASPDVKVTQIPFDDDVYSNTG
jgi:hypothetical protein